VRISIGPVLALVITITWGTSQIVASSADEEYYPLAMGRTWTYRIHYLDSSKKQDSKVAWRVTKVEDSNNGKVFQVWPFPVDPDDSAMFLRVVCLSEITFRAFRNSYEYVMAVGNCIAGQLSNALGAL